MRRTSKSCPPLSALSGRGGATGFVRLCPLCPEGIQPTVFTYENGISSLVRLVPANIGTASVDRTAGGKGETPLRGFPFPFGTRPACVPLSGSSDGGAF